MDNKYVTIGKNIKLFREKFNYTQNEIAKFNKIVKNYLKLKKLEKKHNVKT